VEEIECLRDEARPTGSLQFAISLLVQAPGRGVLHDESVESIPGALRGRHCERLEHGGYERKDLRFL
jgi:hypothetical protein